MGTLLLFSTWRTGRPALSMASSKEKEHPMIKVTKSSLQYSIMSVGSSAKFPSKYTLYLQFYIRKTK